MPDVLQLVCLHDAYKIGRYNDRPDVGSVQPSLKAKSLLHCLTSQSTA